MTQDKITLPAGWASALINGDFSDLTRLEAERCQKKVDELAAEGWHVVDVERDADGEAPAPYFTSCYNLYDPESGFSSGEILGYVMYRSEREPVALVVEREHTMSTRYTVKTDVPLFLRNRGFVAYVADAMHPDDPTGGPLSMSWHQTEADAQRVCKAMNVMS